jgi:hypothetical protein
MDAKCHSWRAAPDQAETDPKQRQPGRPPPLSIYDDVLGGEEGGRDWNAQPGFHPAAPCQLLDRRDHAGERHQLKGRRICGACRRFVTEERAAQRVPDQGQWNADQKRHRTPISAGPRSAIAQSDDCEKWIRGQPSARTGWREPARHGLRGCDRRRPQQRLQLRFSVERLCAGVPRGGAPSGGVVKRPNCLTCLRTPVPHSGPPWTNA